MDSTDSTFSGFSRWQSLNDRTIDLAPSEKGVYVLRRTRGEKITRLRGVSDVLLIGSTKQPIRRRLAEVLRAQEDKGHDFYVREMAKKHGAQISWKIDEDPKRLEAFLLGRYLEDHDELPPLNAQKILSLYRVLLGRPDRANKPSMDIVSLNEFLR